MIQAHLIWDNVYASVLAESVPLRMRRSIAARRNLFHAKPDWSGTWL